ncbi:unnamed protein product [Lupinus luteus]|uniref:Maturase K n=1 Tax=Lupinus luteus TaxID=3873 RepID=A0AAV1WK92_LUPLU
MEYRDNFAGNHYNPGQRRHPLILLSLSKWFTMYYIKSKSSNLKAWKMVRQRVYTRAYELHLQALPGDPAPVSHPGGNGHGHPPGHQTFILGYFRVSSNNFAKKLHKWLSLHQDSLHKKKANKRYVISRSLYSPSKF